MSLSLNHIILHSLSRNADGELIIQPRTEELNVTPAVTALIDEVASSYNRKGGKAFAFFKAASDEESSFSSLLNELLAGQYTFSEFSCQALVRLKEELEKYEFTDGGVLLLAHYTWIAADYLLVALLSDKTGFSVDASLEPLTTSQLDLSSIQLAARVDITEWQRDRDSNRYLSFIKGRAGRKVADFFLDFLGCEEGMDPKVQNQLLMSAVENYVGSCEPDAKVRHEVRKEVSDYCCTQLSSGSEIELKQLADILPVNENSDFYQFSTSNYDLEERFPADRSQVRKLTKFIGQGGGVSLSFDFKLLGDRVHYEPVTDTLTIKGIPPNLREQLRRSLADNLPDESE